MLPGKAIAKAKRRLPARAQAVLAAYRDAYVQAVRGASRPDADPWAAELPPADFLPPEDTEPADVIPPSRITVGTLVPEGVDLRDLTFYVPVYDIDRVREVANTHQIPLEVVPMTPEEVAKRLAGYGASRADARRIADNYLRVSVQVPRNQWAVIADAERVQVESHTGRELPGAVVRNMPGVDYWTPERVGQLDFRVCDKCGVRHDRNHIYIVSDSKTGRTAQVGGVCAENLDAGKQVARWIKGIKALSALLGDFEGAILAGDDDDPDAPRGRRRRSFGLTPRELRTFMVLTDFAVGHFGWVSGREAYETGVMSTRQLVGAAMLDGKSPPVGGVTWRVSDVVALAEASGRADWLVDRVRAWTDQKLQDPTLPQDMASNLTLGVYGGANKALGLVAWAVKEARSLLPTLAPMIEQGHSWDVEEGMAVLTGADLAAVLARGRWDVEDFAVAISAKPSQLERALSNPDKAMPKALLAKLAKVPQGVWIVARKVVFDGDYGRVYKATVVRPEDYARLQLSGTGIQNVGAGDTVTFGTVQIKGGLTRSYDWRKAGITLPPMPQATRVSAVIRNDINALDVPPVPPIPHRERIP